MQAERDKALLVEALRRRQLTKRLLEVCERVERPSREPRNHPHPRKSAELSGDARREANELYAKGEHDSGQGPVATALLHEHVLRLYGKSLAYAPPGSEELTLTYASRSALLLHVHRYEDSIRDVDRALAGNPDDCLRIKLLCRKAKCLTALGSHEPSREALEEAERSFSDIQREANKDDGANKASTAVSIPVRSEAVQSKLVKMLSSARISYDESQRVDVNGEVATKASGTSDNRSSRTGSASVSRNISRSVSLDHSMIESPNSVRIEQTNDATGQRYLVASKNYEPGELVLAEPLYASQLDDPQLRGYTNCCNCLALSWCAVPCNRCSWAVFCSESCRDEAEPSRHHEAECEIVPRLRAFDDELATVGRYELCLRALVRGLAEAGDSVDNLRRQLREVDECKDARLRGFLARDGSFESCTFRSLYSLQNDSTTDPTPSDRCIKFVTLVVICLARYTDFLGEAYAWSGVEDLACNDDALFLGTLILKLHRIKSLDCHAFADASQDCEYTSEQCSHQGSRRCLLGFCMSPLGSLVGHSCAPNAATCFSGDRRLLVYALRPIKKDSQIFISHRQPFYKEPKILRHERLSHCDHICDCEACVENWPPLLLGENFNNIFDTPEKYGKDIDFYNEHKELLDSVYDESTSIDEETIKRLSKTIAEATNHLIQPSPTTWLAIAGLQDVFEKLYGLTPQEFYSCETELGSI